MAAHHHRYANGIECSAKKSSPVSLVVSDDFPPAVLEDSDAGISGSQVDSDHRSDGFFAFLVLGQHQRSHQQRSQTHETEKIPHFFIFFVKRREIKSLRRDAVKLIYIVRVLGSDICFQI